MAKASAASTVKPTPAWAPSMRRRLAKPPTLLAEPAEICRLNQRPAIDRQQYAATMHKSMIPGRRPDR